jgi:hypothetical protein
VCGAPVEHTAGVVVEVIVVVVLEIQLELQAPKYMQIAKENKNQEDMNNLRIST